MDTFSALADETRRNIIELLAESGQLTASDIYKKFTVTPPAISQHLKVLRESNLVSVHKEAQKRVYQINGDKISELENWAKKLNLLWKESFDKLDEVLKEMKHGK